MTDLRSILAVHAARYPAMQLMDFVKLIYQNEYGCGHFVDDPKRSFDLLLTEWAQVVPDLLRPLTEDIGDGFCRLDLRAARARGLSPDAVNKLFAKSANAHQGSDGRFLSKLEVLGCMIGEGALDFALSELREITAQLQNGGFSPVSHTEAYRSAYTPAYRVIDARYASYLPLLTRIDALLAEKPRVTVAVDGMCGAGKSTLCDLLSPLYTAPVVRMDDFFLPPDLRTSARLSEPGGNVHYERFAQEVAPFIGHNCAFSYGVFDCSVMAITGRKTINPSPLLIVDGSYCMRPEFQALYDVKIFMKTPPELQRARIVSRNGDQLYSDFKYKWIPMENAYFSHFSIKETCDFVLVDTGGDS